MNLIRNLPTMTKMMLAVTLVVVMIGVVGGVGWYSMKSIQSNIDAIYNDRLIPTVHLAKANEAVKSLRGDLWKAQGAVSDSARTEALNQMEADFQALDNALKAYSQKSNLTPREKELLARIKDHIEKYRRAAQEFAGMFGSGYTQEQREIFLTDTLRHHRQAAETSIKDLYQLNQDMASELKSRSENTYAGSSRFILALTLVLLVVAYVFGITIARQISVPLKAAVDYLNIVAHGDFGRQVPGELLERKDEIGMVGQAIQTMTAELRQLMREVVAGAKELAVMVWIA